MKKVLAIAVVLATASSAMAFGFLGQNAEPLAVGEVRGSVGGFVGVGDADMQLVTVRGTFGAAENLLVSLDVGYEFDVIEEMAVAAAVQYSFADALADVPVDVALRASYLVLDFEFEDMGYVDVMAVCSFRPAEMKELSLYGAVGAMFPLMDNADEELVLTGGAEFSLPDADGLSLFAEFTFVDEPFVAGGLTAAF